MLLGEMIVVRGITSPSQIEAALEHQRAQAGRRRHWPLGEKAHEMITLIYGSSHPWAEESATVTEACEAALRDHGPYALARLRAAKAASGN
jgi:hypothetical protein